MLSSHRNFSQEEPLIIASPHVVYRSSQLIDEIEREQALMLFKRMMGGEIKREWVQMLFKKSNDISETLGTSRMSPSELHEIQAFFQLFIGDLLHPFMFEKKRGDFDSHMYEQFRYTLNSFKTSYETLMRRALKQEAQFIEKVVLASLFLDKNLLDDFGRKIHDIISRTIYPDDHYGHDFWDSYSYDSSYLRGLSPIERIENYFISPNYWRILLSSSSITEKESFLDLEVDSVMVEDLKINPLTKSYYYISKNELINRVKHLLCRGLFNDVEPNTMDEVIELYERLLNYKEAIMLEMAFNQFPEDEVVFLWNRSIIGQSLEKAWHLPLVPERVDDSIPNFKVTHHRNVKEGNQLIPVIDVEVWTNDQLRDALGRDWMFDLELTLEDNWVYIKKEVDLRVVKEVVKKVTRIYNGIYNKDRFSLVDQLFLEEFNPEEILRRISSDDDEKELVEQNSDESRSLRRTKMISDLSKLNTEEEFLRMRLEELEEVTELEDNDVSDYDAVTHC